MTRATTLVLMYIEKASIEELKLFQERIQQVFFRKKGGLSSNTYDQIADLIRNNRKLEAVKLYKTATGVGLKEAKDFIDEYGENIKLIDQLNGIAPL